MKAIGIALLLALELGGAFGAATATVESIADDSMILTLEVELKSSAEAVVAHLAFDDDPQIALPLLDRGGGVFGITTELPAKNYAVVFEAIGIDDGLSPAVLISDLGADFGDNDVPTPTTEPKPDEGLSPATKRFGWLALALTAGSLSLLAVWVIIGRDKDAESPDVSEEE
jgi:hypothetical protein